MLKALTNMLKDDTLMKNRKKKMVKTHKEEPWLIVL